MPRTLHVDSILTDYAVAYMRDASTYIADQAVPIAPVSKQSDYYNVWSRADFARDDAKPRGPGAPAAETIASLSTDSYRAEVYALKGKSIDRERDSADDPVGYEQGVTASVIDQLLLRRERAFLARAMLTTSWDSSNRMTGDDDVTTPYASTFTSFNTAGSDPIMTMNYAHTLVRRGTNGRRADTMIVSPNVHDYLIGHSAIAPKIVYGGQLQNPAVITSDPQAAQLSVMAKIFGVQRYLVANSAYNTAIQNAAGSYSDVAADQILLMYCPLNAPPMAPTAMRAFSWSPYDQAKGPGKVTVKRYREEAIESDWLESQFAVDFKVVASSAGVILSSCLNTD